MAEYVERELTIKGMDCPNCAAGLQKGLRGMAGVDTAVVHFATEKLRVSGTATRAEIVERVEALGYAVAAEELSVERGAPRHFWGYLWQRWETRTALMGLGLIAPSFLLTELLGYAFWLLDGLSLVALGCAGWPVFRRAWRALWLNRAVTMNLLMSVAALGAVVIGAYTEAGMVMVLFAIGEALEGYTADKARQSIRSLMEVQPREAVRLGEDGTAEAVAIEVLQVGDRLLVKPGECVPMDGLVVAGTSAVNQAPITGESRLVEKEVGDNLFASSVNGGGALEMCVTHLVADNTISRLIRLVEEAQENQAPTQRFVDQFAQYYTLAVMLVAFFVAVLPPLVAGEPFWNPAVGTTGWLYRGLALLVVACPCALVISTPVSLISAISNGARHGVLFKGGAHVEGLSRVKAIGFDKTGTLTRGEPAVVSVKSAECQQAEPCEPCDELVALAYAVEQRSEHPLAYAIVAEAARRRVTGRYAAAEGVMALAGQGVHGRVENQAVLIGSHAYFDRRPIAHSMTQCERATAEAAQGRTAVMVSADGVYRGLISLADTVRESSREAIAKLKALGIQHIVMLTGDNRPTAAQIATAVGVTEVKAELLPEDKVTAVGQLQKLFGVVAMVGDGINDAPALAMADVGIAIGTTAQAMETADISLLGDDLRQLGYAYALSRAAMKTIYVNVLLAISLKLAFMVLLVMGLGSMWLAVAADVGVALVVTLNGMRLLTRRF